jgi:hypothetical protein
VGGRRLGVADPADGGPGRRVAITRSQDSRLRLVFEAGGPGSSLALAAMNWSTAAPPISLASPTNFRSSRCSASLGGELACLPEIPVAEESDKNDNHERRGKELAAWDNVPGREQH